MLPSKEWFYLLAKYVIISLITFVYRPEKCPLPTLNLHPGYMYVHFITSTKCCKAKNVMTEQLVKMLPVLYSYNENVGCNMIQRKLCIWYKFIRKQGLLGKEN